MRSLKEPGEQAAATEARPSACKVPVQYKAANLVKRWRKSRILAGYPICIPKRIIHQDFAPRHAIFAPGRERKGLGEDDPPDSADSHSSPSVAHGAKKSSGSAEAGWNSTHRCGSCSMSS
jgi:hypothetical protein